MSIRGYRSSTSIKTADTCWRCFRSASLPSGDTGPGLTMRVCPIQSRSCALTHSSKNGRWLVHECSFAVGGVLFHRLLRCKKSLRQEPGIPSIRPNQLASSWHPAALVHRPPFVQPSGRLIDSISIAPVLTLLGEDFLRLASSRASPRGPSQA